MEDKLMLLDENIRTLEEIKNDLEKKSIDKRLEWEIRYGLLESIQIVIDISCKLVSKYNLGKPNNYRECIEILGKNSFIDEKLSKNISSMVGFRNLLIHEYVKIDKDKILKFLKELDDFKRFIKQIKEY